VLSELIGVALDRELEPALKLSKDISFRYTDDFFIGLRDGRTPEQAIASVARVLSTYELEMSSDKTRVVAAASRADPDWALEISQFRLPADEGRKRRALEFYFKKAFHLAQANPGQNVLSYCVSRSRAFAVDRASWPTYEEFLLQSARANSTTIEMVARILIDGSRARMPLNSLWIGRLVDDLIAGHAPLGHHWEVCWLLFLARDLGLAISDVLVQACEKVEGSVVGFLLLDLGARDLAKVGGLKHRLVRDLSSESLKSPEWLIVYEGARLGWLGPDAVKIVADNQYFAGLNEQKVEFYDTRRTTQAIEKEKVEPGAPYYDPSYFRF
jgi:hypothetical protein